MLAFAPVCVCVQILADLQAGSPPDPKTQCMFCKVGRRERVVVFRSIGGSDSAT